MEFGESVALGLEVLGEGGAVDEEGLRALTEAAVKAALEQDATAELSAITLPGSVAKPALQAIATVLLESAKYNATQPEVVDALEENGLPSKRAAFVAGVVNRERDSVRAHLMTKTFSASKILDVQWRVDHSVRTKYQDQIGEATFLISILTGAPAVAGGGEMVRQEVQFACTKEELQSLVGKLKDACTQVDRILGTTRGGRR